MTLTKETIDCLRVATEPVCVLSVDTVTISADLLTALLGAAEAGRNAVRLIEIGSDPSHRCEPGGDCGTCEEDIGDATKLLVDALAALDAADA